jgi:hypothetical protein
MRAQEFRGGPDTEEMRQIEIAIGPARPEDRGVVLGKARQDLDLQARITLELQLVVIGRAVEQIRPMLFQFGKPGAVDELPKPPCARCWRLRGRLACTFDLDDAIELLVGNLGANSVRHLPISSKAETRRPEASARRAV